MKDLFEERYRATPQALDRESIIEHLLGVAQEENMLDCIFNKCDAMIKHCSVALRYAQPYEEQKQRYTSDDIRVDERYIIKE